MANLLDSMPALHRSCLTGSKLEQLCSQITKEIESPLSYIILAAEEQMEAITRCVCVFCELSYYMYY